MPCCNDVAVVAAAPLLARAPTVASGASWLWEVCTLSEKLSASVGFAAVSVETVLSPSPPWLIANFIFGCSFSNFGGLPFLAPTFGALFKARLKNELTKQEMTSLSISGYNVFQLKHQYVASPISNGKPVETSQQTARFASCPLKPSRQPFSSSLPCARAVCPLEHHRAAVSTPRQRRTLRLATMLRNDALDDNMEENTSGMLVRGMHCCTMELFVRVDGWVYLHILALCCGR